MDKLQIVKIGGNVIENRKALKEFLADFSEIKGAKIVIHGGGKEATQMAKKLGIQVVAEGIETSEQLNTLKSMGCEYGQGYYFSKPVSKSQFESILMNQSEEKSLST